MKTKAVIENGFKETEIGLIPEDWQVKGFEECIDKERISRDIKIPQGKYKKVGRYPIVDQGASFVAGYTDDKSKLYSGCLPVIVFGDHTRIFKFVDFSFSLGADGTKLIQPKDFLNPKYFYYYFCSLTIESKGYNRHYKYLKEKFIAFPERPEQRKIAFVLSKIQQAIEQQDRIIETTKELKKSLMNKLFTEGLHGEEQKETEIGLMPKSWQVRTVKNTCEKPQYGYTESASDKPIGPKFLRITDITDKGVDWLKVPYCKCPQELINKYKLEKEDILFARIGATTGKSFIVEKCPFAVYASYLIRLRTKTELNPMYLYYFFNSEMYWKQIDAHKGSSLKKGVNGSILASLIFSFPKKQEQEEIANILLSIDKKISQAESKKQTLQALFRTMLNQLMMGKVRVKDFDFEVN